MTERDLIRNWMLWKEERDGRYFSQKDLAQRAGLSPTYLSSILTGTRNAGTKTIDRLAEALGISRAEFYAGPSGYRGGCESVPEKVPELQSFVPPVSNQESPFQALDAGEEPSVTPAHTGWNLSWTASEEVERLFGADDGMHAAPPSLRTHGERHPVEKGIPVLRAVPDGGWAGWHPAGNVEHSSLSRALFGRPRIFAIRVEDDSMVPILEEGSIVVADADVAFNAHPGRIAVVPGKDELLVRLVERTAEGYLFFPANPAYDPETAGLDAVLFPAVCIIPPGMATE